MKNIIVGLTGQTGAGKTTVSGFLLDNGIPVVDADQVAREVVGKGSSCIADIALEFGCDYLNIDGTLNRRKLAETVFTDKAKLRRLNNLMFPYILDSIRQRLGEFRERGEGILVLDAPTLFESGIDRDCDRVVSVIAPVELRKGRIMHRDQLSEEEALHRITAQHQEEFYISRSWSVLTNDSDREDLRMQTGILISRLRELLEHDGEESLPAGESSCEKPSPGDLPAQALPCPEEPSPNALPENGGPGDTIPGDTNPGDPAPVESLTEH